MKDGGLLYSTVLWCRVKQHDTGNFAAGLYSSYHQNQQWAVSGQVELQRCLPGDLRRFWSGCSARTLCQGGGRLLCSRNTGRSGLPGQVSHLCYLPSVTCLQNCFLLLGFRAQATQTIRLLIAVGMIPPSPRICIKMNFCDAVNRLGLSPEATA